MATLGVAVEGGLIVLAALLSWLLRLPIREELNWTWRALAQGVLACLPLAAMLLVLRSAPWTPIRELNRLVDESLTPLFKSCSWKQLALIAVLAGIGEEWLFRGVLQRGLTPWLGTVGACAAASLAFGAVHAVSMTYAVLATLIGAYLGWLWQTTGNLLPPMIAHALYDWIALVYLTRFVPLPRSGNADAGSE
jgi:membrane protease YdiL (CAAX protease family)